MNFIKHLLPPSNEVLGKVIFLLSAMKLRRLCFYTCLSVHRWGCLPQCMVGYQSLQEQTPPTPQSRQPLGAAIPQEQTPSGADPPRSRHPLRSRHFPPPLGADGYCCRQYESYWNAFLLHLSVILFTWGGGIPACIAGGIPACLAGFKAHTQGREVEGDLARGVSRPTPKGGS